MSWRWFDNDESKRTKNVPRAHWAALKRAISSDADVSEGVHILVAELDGAIVGSVARTDITIRFPTSGRRHHCEGISSFR